MAGLIDQDVGLTDEAIQEKGVLQLLKTYPLEIPVDHPLPVHVDQTLRDVAQLGRPHQRQTYIVGAWRGN